MPPRAATLQPTGLQLWVSPCLAPCQRHPRSCHRMPTHCRAAVQVKYLSSPRLMGLQLSDASLRRHFLVQALIFLQACKVPGRGRSSALKPKQARPPRS